MALPADVVELCVAVLHELYTSACRGYIGYNSNFIGHYYELICISSAHNAMSISIQS